jgi:hypothetical protein
MNPSKKERIAKIAKRLGMPAPELETVLDVMLKRTFFIRELEDDPKYGPFLSEQSKLVLAEIAFPLPDKIRGKSGE